MISSDLREKIIEYVESRISLEELETWLAPQLHGFLSDPYTSDSEVAADIELGLVDIANSVRSEEDLRQLLNEKLKEAPATRIIYEASGYELSGSSSRTTRQSVASAGTPMSAQLAQLPAGYTSYETEAR